jgi:hypothetical protein
LLAGEEDVFEDRMQLIDAYTYYKNIHVLQKHTHTTKTYIISASFGGYGIDNTDLVYKHS